LAEYRLSPAAQRDLNDIFDHTVQHWGVAHALRVAMVRLMAFADIAAASDY
jgi:toxin ParE1/3/4